MARASLLGLMLLAGAFCGGCSTLINPYLDVTPLNTAALCPEKTDCGPVSQFRKNQDAVGTVQGNAHDGYKQRAMLNTVSSAIAFPLVGILLYKGATNTTD